uniref:Major facilitator superfamily (MFS) profile domain-containing protein n=1 Tax=Strigamia maritima TaxID=126957 RepID=T1JLE8_STRMM
MKFDEVLKVLGEFGPYQKRIYLLLCLPAYPLCALHKLVWVFVGAIPQYRCSTIIDEVFNNSLPYHLPEPILNFTIPFLTKNKIDSCHYYVMNETLANDLPIDSILLTEWPGILQNISTGKSQKCSSYVYDKSVYQNSVVSDFNLVCDYNWQRALVQSLFMAGEFLGSLVAGTISDKFGRRRVFFTACIFQAVFGILSGIVSNYYLYLIFRALVGLFTPGVFLVGFVIGLELVGPSRRLFAGIGCQFFFATGYLLAAGAAYLIREWQYLQIAISVPGLLFLSYWWFIPESARWLLAKKKLKDAKILLGKVAQENGTKLPENFEEPDLHSTAKEEDNPLLLFKYPNLRKKFVNSGVYYGLALNTSNLGGNDYVNFVIAAALEFPAYIFCILALNRLGRRNPLSGWLLIAGSSLIVTSFLNDENSRALIILAMIGKFGITISYAVIYIFSAELYPTVVRNLGMGMSSTCARLGGIIAPFVILLADVNRALPLVVFGIAAVLAGILALFLPETRGANLPDTLEEGEQFGKS